MRAKILPAVARTDIAAAHRTKWHRAGQRESGTLPLREEHRHAFPCADPSAVAAAAVVDVRRQQSKDGIVRDLALQSLELNRLQKNIAFRVGDDGLGDAITTFNTLVDDAITRHTLR